MTQTPAPPHIRFLDPLRAGAALLVVWDHLFCMAPESAGEPLFVARQVARWVNEPLGLIQNFGWFGVCLFFLISGFVITHVSRRESARAFAIKRFFRIVPMLGVAVLVSVLLAHELRAQATPWNLLTNVALVNYWIHPQVVLLGVGWTLAIEVLFYALMLCTYRLGRWPAGRTLAMLLVVALVVHNARAFGPSFFLFAASAAYLPYLLTGQLMYLALHERSIGPAQAGALAVLIYAVLLQGLTSIHSQFLPLNNSYLISFAWALVVFLLAWKMSAHGRGSALARWMADASYTLYLLHGSVGFSVFGLVRPKLGASWAVAIALGVVAVAVVVLHLLVERPAQALGRRLAMRPASSTA